MSHITNLPMHIRNSILSDFDLKLCACCKVPKPTDQFYKSPQPKDGLQSYCKNCNKEKRNSKEGKNYYNRHKEKLRVAYNKRYKDNIEEERAKVREKYWRNLCEVRQYYREYSKEYRKTCKSKAYYKRRYKQNKEPKTSNWKIVAIRYLTESRIQKHLNITSQHLKS